MTISEGDAADERLRRAEQRHDHGVVAQSPARRDDEPLGLGDDRRAHSTILGSSRTYSRSAIRFAITIDAVMIRNAPCSIG